MQIEIFSSFWRKEFIWRRWRWRWRRRATMMTIYEKKNSFKSTPAEKKRKHSGQVQIIKWILTMLKYGELIAKPIVKLSGPIDLWNDFPQNWTVESSWCRWYCWNASNRIAHKQFTLFLFFPFQITQLVLIEYSFYCWKVFMIRNDKSENRN